jgi:hypothetical protein
VKGEGFRFHGLASFFVGVAAPDGK